MERLLAVLGSVTPPGRMSKAITSTLDAAKLRIPSLGTELLNLADYRVSFADGRPLGEYGDDSGNLVRRVEQADAVLICSPVYRGSMTGSLKNLLDLLPIEALRAKPCGIVAMGASNHHYLGVDWHLRDVLAWFGALVAPTSVYLSSADFPQGEPSAEAQRELQSLIEALRRLHQIAPAAGEAFGPLPLAARNR
ncbi:MAG TPA: NADPH-dependent FMN reductase [Candidatus Binataceae bacterium]|jgi:FMN reductase